MGGCRVVIVGETGSGKTTQIPQYMGFDIIMTHHPTNLLLRSLPASASAIALEGPQRMLYVELIDSARADRCASGGAEFWN